MTDENETLDPNVGTAIPGESEAGRDSAAESAELERRARLHGWKDKTEFDRPPERWVDASTYLRRQDENLPVLKENLHRIEAKLGNTETQNRELASQVAGLTAAFDHMSSMAMSAEQRAYDRAVKDLIERKRVLEGELDTAVATADVPKARSARDAIMSLQMPAPPAKVPLPQARPTAAPAPGVDPSEKAAVDSFTANEKWFEMRSPDGATVVRQGNRAATLVAADEYGRLARARPDMTPQERLAAAKRAALDAFPGLDGLERSNTGGPSRVATPSGGNGARPQGSGSGRSWGDIPAEDRSAMQKSIDDVNRGRKDGKKATQAEFAAIYWKGQ